MNPILQIISQMMPLSVELERDLSQVLLCEEVERNEHMLLAGQVAKRIYFIEQGLVHAYYLDGEKGREMSSWFMKEGDFIISVISFFTQIPSQEYMQALEPTRYWSITYDQFQQLYTKHPEFNRVGRMLTEKYYVLSEVRAVHLRLDSADTRFRHMLTEFPDIFDRVPLRLIASYLGMSAETLSRARTRLLGPGPERPALGKAGSRKKS